jgi:hypothetical protein
VAKSAPVITKPAASAPGAPAPAKTVVAKPPAVGKSVPIKAAAPAPAAVPATPVKTSRECSTEATEQGLSGPDRVAFYKQCTGRK